MYGYQSGEFIGGYWGILKGFVEHKTTYVQLVLLRLLSHFLTGHYLDPTEDL